MSKRKEDETSPEDDLGERLEPSHLKEANRFIQAINTSVKKSYPDLNVFADNLTVLWMEWSDEELGITPEQVVDMFPPEKGGMSLEEVMRKYREEMEKNRNLDIQSAQQTEVDVHIFGNDRSKMENALGDIDSLAEDLGGTNTHPLLKEVRVRENVGRKVMLEMGGDSKRLDPKSYPKFHSWDIFTFR